MPDAPDTDELGHHQFMTITQDTADPVDATDLSQTTLLPESSDQTPTVSVILPTLNEEDGIRTCIRKVERALADMGVTGEVIVSDSSSDRTPEIAREMGAIVVEPDKTGYGYAYQYGFRFARGEYVAIGDADTTYDFEELPKLFALVEDGADMAIGSRLRGEIKPGSMPKLHRYVGNPLLTRFLNFFYDADVSDAHSGMRVIRREALSELTLESEGMEFASEMIMAASAAGLDIREAPITYHERTGEATLDSFHDGWRHVRFMLVNAPGHLFSWPGIALSSLGILTLSAALTNAFGPNVLGLRSVMVGCLLIMSGFQVLNMGVFATIAGNPIQESTNRWNRLVREEVSLEHGISVGMLFSLVGAVYATWSLYQWVGSVFTELTTLTSDIIAFTAIVIGIQTVFQSFLLSMLGSRSDS